MPPGRAQHAPAILAAHCASSDSSAPAPDAPPAPAADVEAAPPAPAADAPPAPAAEVEVVGMTDGAERADERPAAYRAVWPAADGADGAEAPRRPPPAPLDSLQRLGQSPTAAAPAPFGVLRERGGGPPGAEHDDGPEPGAEPGVEPAAPPPAPADGAAARDAVAAVAARYAPPEASRSAAEFADAPLRRGKWTEAEETYTELLIQHFLAGVVPVCAEGTSLRAFLAARLHCAPMRITKKFAVAASENVRGAALGKHLFRRRGYLDERELGRLRRLEASFASAEDLTFRQLGVRAPEVARAPPAPAAAPDALALLAAAGASKRPRPEDAADDADGPPRPSAWALKRLDASSEDGARAAPEAEGLPPPNPRERAAGEAPPAAGAFLVPLRVGRGMTPGTVIEMSIGGAKYRAAVPAGAVEGQTVTLPSSALARVPDPAATPAAAPPALPAPGSPRVVFRGSPW